MGFVGTLGICGDCRGSAGVLIGSYMGLNQRNSLAPYLTPKPPVCKRFHHAASDTQDGIAKQPGSVERNSNVRSNQVLMVVPVPPWKTPA